MMGQTSASTTVESGRAADITEDAKRARDKAISKIAALSTSAAQRQTPLKRFKRTLPKIPPGLAPPPTDVEASTSTPVAHIQPPPPLVVNIKKELDDDSYNDKVNSSYKQMHENSLTPIPSKKKKSSAFLPAPNIKLEESEGPEDPLGLNESGPSSLPEDHAAEADPLTITEVSFMDFFFNF